MHGQGVYNHKDGRVYRGQWLNGENAGEGEMRWPSGALYTGQFEKGKRHGKGTLIGQDGMKYIGQWVNGEQDGIGTAMGSDGTQKTYRWKRGQPIEEVDTLRSPSTATVSLPPSKGRLESKGTQQSGQSCSTNMSDDKSPANSDTSTTDRDTLTSEFSR